MTSKKKVSKKKTTAKKKAPTKRYKKNAAYRRVLKGNEVTKCTEEVVETIAKYVSIGTPVNSACAIAGVRNKTFLEWMKISHQKAYHINKKIYKKLRFEIEKAAALVVAKDCNTVDKSSQGEETEYERYPAGAIDPKTGISLEGQVVLDGSGKAIVKKKGIERDWKAAAWRLERLAKNTYGRPTVQSNISVSDSSDVGTGGGEREIKITFVRPDPVSEEEEEVEPV